MQLSQLIDKVKRSSGGVIVKKQTTYFDVDVDSEIFRVSYRGKLEFNFVNDRFGNISLHEDHQLLIDYLETMVAVHLGSKVNDAEEFREILNVGATDVFGKWRLVGRYLNLPLDRFLQRPYGLLMTAPETFARLIVERSKEIGVKLIVHKGTKTKRHPKVIVMDANFVIADEFCVNRCA